MSGVHVKADLVRVVISLKNAHLSAKNSLILHVNYQRILGSNKVTAFY